MKFEKIKILIVDDDQAYAEGISSLLITEGYACKTVNDSRSTFKILEGMKPEILLVDWQMPGLSGVDLMQRIRLHPDFRQMYIIMVSGKSTVEDKVTGIDAGADDYLSKPFESEELLARIRAAIRILNLEKELVEQDKRNTVLEMALSITDKIGNPLASARMLQQFIQANIRQYSKITQPVQDLGTLLIEIQELLRKYQSINIPKTIPSAMGKKMINPNSNNL